MRSIAKRMFQFLFAGLLLSASFSSHAIPSGGPIPTGANLSSILVKPYAPSTLDLPPTAYLIPNSAFVILDPAKANATSAYGAMFGSLGVLIHSAVGKSDTAKAVDGSQRPLIDLVDLVESHVRTSKVSKPDSAATFEITPSGWVFVKGAGDKGTLVIKLDVQWKDSSGDLTWRQDYFYNVLQERPLVGTDGWFSEGTPALRQASELGVSKLADLFLRELSGAQTYADAEIKLGGCFPGARKLTLLAENNDEIVVRVQGNRSSGSSIQILNRAQCEISK